VSTPGAPRLARAGRAMALGTLASRLTGFARTIALAAALGAHGPADAYNFGNTLPNIVYDLLLGGILSSVVVPVLVAARDDDPDSGRDLGSALLTLVVVGLTIAVGVGVAAAPWLVRLYGVTPSQRALAVEFTRFFLPQTIFYGITGVVTAVMNTRGRFTAPTVVPVLNNLVLLATIAVFLLLPGARHVGTGLTRVQTLTLGTGTTAGVVVMALGLLPGLRGTGVRLSWRVLRHQPGLGRVGRLAGWVLGYAATNQLGYVFVLNFAGTGTGRYSDYSYAYQLFQLPYAVVSVSVISALMPRMSGHAHARRRIAVTSDVSRGLRLSAALLVPGALLLVAVSEPLTAGMLRYGALSYAESRVIADGLAAFALSLPAFSAFQLLLRAFYAARDTRTPTLVNVGATAVTVVFDALVVLDAPVHDRVTGLALGFGVGYLVGAVVLFALLRHQLLGLDSYRVTRLTVRVGVASLAAAAVARVIGDAVRAAGGPGQPVALAATAAALAVGGGVYLVLARRMHIGEVDEILGLLPRRAQSALRVRRSP
jgi:putative peptidoglycan lipid II flippase